jgi:hypothetical protein
MRSHPSLTIAVVLTVWTSTGTVDAQPRQSTQALTHFFHVATGFSGAPGGRGLAVTAAVEVNAAMRFSNVAAGHPTDLAAMQAAARNVLHALVPAEGAQGPGLGFGVTRAAEAIATHMGLALKANDASETIRKHGPGIVSAARALAARSRNMAEVCSGILAASAAAEAAALASQLRKAALELDTGLDRDGNGRVDPDALEPGMNQLEAGVYAILEGEKLPRVLS